MRNSAPSPGPPRRRAALVSLLAWPRGGAAARGTGIGLADTLPRLLAGCGLPTASLGLCVTTVDSGRVVATLNAEGNPFVMASTAKIVTSLAALHLLGPRWRWRTQAFVTGPVIGGRCWAIC
jgi:D-alanyl-D-alanine carboxypeptidase/D-alanyl-D-alanine-endopeptidase (penicillin-binding protein 4)